MPANHRLTLDAAATYEIRLQGSLDERWSDYMGGASIRVQRQPDGSPITVVTGEFQDQAALAGALSFLYDLGLPLLSVACIDVASNNLTRSIAIDALEDGER
jgi:hypothetical protein